MMMHSPAMKTIGLITWVITALISINVLTSAYDYDFFSWLIRTMPGAVVPVLWIAGLSGMISLALFIKMMMFNCCPGCGSYPCTCTTMNSSNNF